MQVVARDARVVTPPAGRCNVSATLDSASARHALFGVVDAGIPQDRGDFGGSHVATFAATPIVTDFGGGVVANFTDAISAFATADYTTDIGGSTRDRAIEGNIGLRIRW